MKRTLLIILALTAFAAVAPAQTADEIIDRMNKEMDKGEAQGTAMTMDMKIPILGTFSTRIKNLGKRSRADMDVKGEKGIIWMHNDTSWTYSSKDDRIEINLVNQKDKSSSKDSEMLYNITDGYDVSIAGETADTWKILCKKSKDNKSKDDSSKMDLVVSKKTYLPVSLSAKAKGVTIILRDFSIGVSKSEVTFNPSAFKSAEIVDKRL